MLGSRIMANLDKLGGLGFFSKRDMITGRVVRSVSKGVRKAFFVQFVLPGKSKKSLSWLTS
jgi:hypothetical protein